MKKIFSLSGLIILLLSSAAAAQINNSAQSKRIVFINKLYFGDERFGVEKYVNAIRAASNLGSPAETDLTKRKAIYDERYRTLVVPVENEISAFLKKVEATNNFEIWDLADIEQTGQVISFNDRFDITAKVISLINLYFEEKREPLLTLVIPETKLAAINTDLLLIELGKTAKFKEKFKQSEALTKAEIGRGIKSYSDKNGFGVVFDSKRKLPSELQNFQIQDITKDFISYYNQLNP